MFHFYRFGVCCPINVASGATCGLLSTAVKMSVLDSSHEAGRGSTPKQARRGTTESSRVLGMIIKIDYHLFMVSNGVGYESEGQLKLLIQRRWSRKPDRVV